MPHNSVKQLLIRKYVFIVVILLFCFLLFLGPLFPGDQLSKIVSRPLFDHRRRTAIVSNLQNERYVVNALVLAYSLQKHNTYLRQQGTELVLMVPYVNDISETSITRLKTLGWQIRYENDITVPGVENLLEIHRRNYIKLRVWRWVEYEKLAWIDADTLIMGDVSLLLSDKFDFGAVQDTWPWVMPGENFNAGVLSITPSLEKYQLLLDATTIYPVEDNGEQNMLNHLFPLPSPESLEASSWLRTELPMKYNLNLEAYSSHREKWDGIWPDARIIHYTMSKPYIGQPRDDPTYAQPLDAWWLEWSEMVATFGWD